MIEFYFCCLAFHALITATVYCSDWLRNLDDSTRIITSTWVASVVGTVVGYALDGLLGATIEMGIAVAAADAIAISCSVYLYLSDQRELHDHKEGMRKHGKES